MYIDKNSIIVNKNHFRYPEYDKLKDNIKKDTIEKRDHVFIKLSGGEIYYRLKRKQLNKLKNIKAVEFKRRIYRKCPTTLYNVKMYEDEEYLTTLEELLAYFVLYKYEMLGFDDASKLIAIEDWWINHSKIKVTYSNGDTKKMNVSKFIDKYIKDETEVESLY